MRRVERFVLSHRPYAVRLDSLRVSQDPYPNQVTVDAVWFRRRRGVTVACLGLLWDHQNPPPVTAEEFLARHTDGRYGGDTLSRWDGASHWGLEPLNVMRQHLTILRPMLERYPNVPQGYDGWWEFEK